VGVAHVVRAITAGRRDVAANTHEGVWIEKDTLRLGPTEVPPPVAQADE
jgi:hypothetical protein